MRIIDRYLAREVLLPFGIGLVVFTFILILPFLIGQAEALITKGVAASVILRVLVTLLPQALALTIPMALLPGLLVALGRLSSDREFVAMQACGISLSRLLRPVGALALLAWAATSYVMLVALPSANQSYREITYNVVAARAEGEVKPRVFFEDFPDLVLYVRDVPPRGGWNQVFMADNRPGQTPAVYLAEHGRVHLDRERRTVEMVLDNGSRHTAQPDGPYEVVTFERLTLSLNPELVFPRTGPQKGEREMSIAELRTRSAELEALGQPTHSPQMEIHKKFSIPAACLVFGLLGLAIGATNRREGWTASFVLGLAVIFAYYVLLWLGQALAKGQAVSPWLAVWLPNLVLGALGALLLVRRRKSADQPLLSLAGLSRFFPRRAPATHSARHPRPVGRALAWLPGPSLLDRYVVATYVRVMLLAAASLAGLFYIATFLDLSDKLFKGQTTWSMLGLFFWYATPQYVYYVVPMAVLLAALVTIGLLTKNSELIVMKACGISLYRVALPMLAVALLAGGLLFALEESVLGPANREAGAIRHQINGGSPQAFGVLSRRWAVGSHDAIYHYTAFDPAARTLTGITVYGFADSMARLASRTWIERAAAVEEGAADWQVSDGWRREFEPSGDTKAFEPLGARRMTLEPVSFFSTERPDPAFMSYTQLRHYITQLQASGFDVSQQQVALARKISFPFVTLIMTLIAVPFAVTTGRRGAMYGVGVGIVLAISYWTAISVFAALGGGGLVAPVLAAWAPNLLFGAGAGYLLLTVRT
ncbi:MAG: LPS export ABC transporter permease LptG [Vicinamibacterales bacterium]